MSNSLKLGLVLGSEATEPPRRPDGGHVVLLAVLGNAFIIAARATFLLLAGVALAGGSVAGVSTAGGLTAGAGGSLLDGPGLRVFRLHSGLIGLEHFGHFFHGRFALDPQPRVFFNRGEFCGSLVQAALCVFELLLEIGVFPFQRAVAFGGVFPD